jgi:hypothetical protein
MDDLAIEVRSPTEAKDVCVQTGSVAHPASCIEVTGGNPSRVEVMNE